MLLRIDFDTFGLADVGTYMRRLCARPREGMNEIHRFDEADVPTRVPARGGQIGGDN